MYTDHCSPDSSADTTVTTSLPSARRIDSVWALTSCSDMSVSSSAGSWSEINSSRSSSGFGWSSSMHRTVPMVFTQFDAEVGDWRDKWDFDDKMVATCCGQPVKRADIRPFWRKTLRNFAGRGGEQRTAANYSRQRCDFHREILSWFAASHCATVVFSEFEGSVHRPVQVNGRQY